MFFRRFRFRIGGTNVAITPIFRKISRNRRQFVHASSTRIIKVITVEIGRLNNKKNQNNFNFFHNIFLKEQEKENIIKINFQTKHFKNYSLPVATRRKIVFSHVR